MIDKAEFFADMKKRLTWDAREPRIAIRYDSDPQDQTEYWYLADAQDGKGYQLQAIHDVIPVSKLEEERANIERKFGSFTQTGMTYEMQPFVVGVKRDGPTTQEELEIMQRVVLTRENYKIMLFNLGVEKMLEGDYPALQEAFANDKLGALLALEAGIAQSVDDIPEARYAAMVDELVKEELNYMTPIDRDAAERRSYAFLQSEPKYDAELIEDGAQKDDADKALFKQFNFDVMTV